MAIAGKSVVVIGAGMGGLAAAIELAASGATVTLVEQQATPGGKMRELFLDQREDRGIDSGPTVFTMRHVFDSLYASAGTRLEDHVKLHQASTLARHSWSDGSRFDLFADIEKTVAAVEKLAGSKEAEAYRRFASESEQIYSTLDESFMRVERPTPISLTAALVRSQGLRGISQLTNTRPFVSLWKELGKLFSDPRLRQLFGRYATYCGSSPFDAPATLMLIAHAERAGVWFVDGGMQRLAESLADLARGAGAHLRFNCAAERIETKSGCVSAVVLADGTSVQADAVVFNGDYAALGQGLLGPSIRDSFQRQLKRRASEPRSLSAVTFSALGTPRGFDLSHHNVFFGDNYADEFDSIFKRRAVAERPTVYLCAQDRGNPNAPAPTDAERLFILVNAPPREMSTHEVQVVRDSTFKFLEHHGLSVDFQGEPITTTPNDYNRRFPGSSGAIYGWPTHGWYGSFRRAGSGTAVGGLFMAGGTVHPGPGVPMAAQSGRIAATRVASYFR